MCGSSRTIRAEGLLVHEPRKVAYGGQKKVIGICAPREGVQNFV